MNLHSQAKIATAASKLLSSSFVRELRQLRVDGEINQLRLTVRIRSYYHKQLAQETIRSVAIGMRMVNRAQVET